MSLLLSWNNDTAAHVLSDGLSIAPDGRAVSRTRRKFFETSGGAIVGSAGFTRLRENLERRFKDSTASFDDLVAEVFSFVRQAWQENEPTDQSQPIGVIVVGNDSGRIRSANVFRDHVQHSLPGMPAVHWATAASDGDPAMREVASKIWQAAPESVAEEMRSGADVLFRRFEGRMGGEIFTASLSAGGV